MARRILTFLLILAAMLNAGCVAGTILRRNVAALASTPRRVPNRIIRPIRTDVRLAVLWVGHATTLVQIDDKFVLTDPVFTDTVGGGFSRRLVEPGILIRDLPPIDIAVVSHLHFDHLSLGTLDLLEPIVKQLLLPRGGLVYLPDYAFAIDEVERWWTFAQGDLRVTAVPVKHPGFRYGADAAWMKQSATGWVIEYHGITVYFGGDTAYEQEAFLATSRRFPKIDLAILPIAPVEPPSFARPSHLDGREAVKAFLDLGAAHMLPIHYDTFPHGVDEQGYAVEVLRGAMRKACIGEDRIHILPVGGQLGLLPQSIRMGLSKPSGLTQNMPQSTRVRTSSATLPMSCPSR